MKRKIIFNLKVMLALLFSVGVLSISAQNITVSGVVTDDEGFEVIGATVVVVGNASHGTVTDIDGNYILNNVPSDASLQFSYVGLKTQVIAVGGRTTINVQLVSDTELLDEVVVTALGIKRDKKALGYAIQEVKSDDIIGAREMNVANALSGKISGLQVIKSNNGPGGSSKIVIRGNSSVTNLNQPLIVVDGVPMENFAGADNNDYWNPGTDMGNGLSDINPEDIETMTVLKGGSAAALYGSRAGNGVILITTKSGAHTEGLGITVSSSVSSESIFLKPKLQSAFGQGEQGVFDVLSRYSWGPAIAGQSYTKWDGTTANMEAYDNYGNYFHKPGLNLTENISMSQQYNKTAVYTSLGRTDDWSITPGADLNRTNLTLRATSTFGSNDRWSTDAKVQYINTSAQNRPVSGQNQSNVFFTMYSLPRTLDIRDFKDRVDETGRMIWYQKTGLPQMNPYWMSKYKLTNDTRERFLMQGNLKYKVTDWLSAEIRAGSDMYFTEYDNREHGKTPISETGRYSFGQDKFFENNFSALISAQKDNILGNWGIGGSLGGNLMHRKKTGLNAGPDELLILNLFTFGNSKNKLEADRIYNEKKINSIYGTAQINYGGYFFIDGTFRNDWSSTLHPDNRSFFYPSISTSLVVSDMINAEGSGMPSWFTFAKVRASFAQVGNDLDPYQLYNTYSIGKDPEDHATAGTNNTLYDSTVRSELISSWEVGADLRFFNNRLGIDFAWYKSNAERQLLNLPMDPLSGYGSKKINAGNIQNDGIELMINVRPIETRNFSWNLQANISKNNNTIIELTEDVVRYQLGGFDNLKIYATAGGNYGEIYGSKFQRVTDKSSPHYGKQIVDKDGLPLGTTESEKIGDQQAKALVGITNSFQYKGFDFSFLIDSRIGGDIFSATNLYLQRFGTANITAPNGKRDDFVIPNSVFVDDSGVMHENSNAITHQQYWERTTNNTGNLGITEANLYSATNIRVRNIQLNYNFNKKMLANTPFTKLKLGVSVNNALMLKHSLKGVDPESVFAIGTNAVGFENTAPPTSRSYLFNVTFGF